MRGVSVDARLWMVCSVLGMTTCGGSQAGEGDPRKGEAVMDQVNFSAEFRISPGRLVIAFSVRNDRDAEIYLIDHAFDVGRDGVTVRPDHLEVRYEDAGQVLLASKLPPLDSTIQWAVPPKIYATPVRPGAQYANEVSAALPLRPKGWRTPRNEQGEVLSDRIIEGQCTGLRFELGVIPADPGESAPTTRLAGVDVVQLGAQAARRQVVLEMKQPGVSVPCLDVVR